MNCISCGKKIAKTRLKVLPDTDLCVNCAKTELVGVTIWTEDGTPKLIMVSPKEAKKIEKENRRSPYS